MSRRPALYDPMRASRSQVEQAARRRREADPHQHHIDRLRRGGQWKTLRRSILDATPLCVDCEREGRVTPATEVDHIAPIARRPDLAFTRSNLQPLCAHHHARKSARERAR